MSVPNNPATSSYAEAPTRFVTAGGITYAYRELGRKDGVPVVFFVHLAGNLDNWDPRIIDPIAKEHHVITFSNRGLGATTGAVPDSIEAMAEDAATFINALGASGKGVHRASPGTPGRARPAGPDPGVPNPA
jgi:pimeloyl-ACP methyl ester carboxylesterase